MYFGSAAQVVNQRFIVLVKLFKGGDVVRLGILGGTFDPIHLGHLRLAEEVGEELALDKVYLIPAAVPPHKEGRPIASFRQRLDMVTLAARPSPLLEPFDLEGRRQGLSYSVETLEELHRLFAPEPDLYFILGMDAFYEIETWHEYTRLFDYAHFVVIPRPGTPSGQLESFLSSLDVPFIKKGRKKGQKQLFSGPSGKELMIKQAVLMDISSTDIRERVAAGKSIRFLVPAEVMDYIREEGLYRTHGIS
jgi:nicotinate-nucleotide adenylyltransferase